mmetsp:Transcript_15139/g.35212  ORF Transcript_15139/g.35212 Transcript_15139/m.35212 type:complete len:83 (+) Transcript_15139:294-542(+)
MLPLPSTPVPLPGAPLAGIPALPARAPGTPRPAANAAPLPPRAAGTPALGAIAALIAFLVSTDADCLFDRTLPPLSELRSEL